MHERLESRLKAEALRLGFSLSGIAPATDADGFARFQHWLDSGYAGEMSYLNRRRMERKNPASILESVRSVLMLGMEYRGCSRDGQRGKTPALSEQLLSNSSLPGSGEPASTSEDSLPTDWKKGRISAYAAGPDYHPYIWDRLNELSQWLMAAVPGSTAVGVTDTAPLLERDFARRAGLGWVGKNTMLINTRRGSFFFLAALLTDLDLQPDAPASGPHCGTCTACQDACPTDAFAQPFVLDATRCISYLTIELRSKIPLELREPMGDWLFGCDVCQEVCPWNRKDSPGPVAFPHDPGLEWLDPVQLLGLDADAFRLRFKKTSLFRSRRAGLLRNAAIVLGNIGDERALVALERAANDTEELIREAATWAIEKIAQRTSRV